MKENVVSKREVQLTPRIIEPDEIGAVSFEEIVNRSAMVLSLSWNQDPIDSEVCAD